MQPHTMCHIPYTIYHVCNQSLTGGVVPDKFKVAKVCPILKHDYKVIFSNYRPISILPTLSKLLETVVNEQVVDYINEENILWHSQFGLRKGFQTRRPQQIF